MNGEIIVSQLGLTKEKKTVTTPGVKDSGSDEDDRPLDEDHATIYRAIVARGNYLAQGRSDILFAVKELSRSMAQPRVEDWEKLKRFGRYLQYKPRVVTHFDYQVRPKEVTTYVDTDYAGCVRTRKSTSGGVAMFGERACSHVWRTRN